MKIAVISTPWLPVPPVGYGGTETVVYNLTEGLVKNGHDVTLFAPGDSKTSAHLEYFHLHAVGNNYFFKLNPYFKLNHLYFALHKISQEGCDIIHCHAGRVASFLLDLQKTPFVHTLHGSYNINLDDQYHVNSAARDSMLLFKHHPYVSISNKQREDIPELNYMATVYNSILIEKFPFSELGGNNIVWLGRISKTKGVEDIIKTTIAVGKPLKISLFIDEGEKAYFKESIEPMLNNPLINHVNEIKDDFKKSRLLQSGKLFLFPIRWDEPFGIVMIEAMATGTPIVAYARGSVPEVVKDGETGFLVNPSENDIYGNWIIKKTGMEGLKEAVENIYSLPEDKYREMRKACRIHVENNFTVNKMVEGYEKVYKQVLSLKS